jgi:hypothetical protein
VAEAVVVGLEAVEVEQHQHVGPVHRRAAFLEIVDEAAPVR